MSITLEAIATKLRSRNSDIQLTAREHQILSLICKGEISKQIAGRLGISQKTVENIRRQLIDKLEAKSSAHMGWLASERGLV